MINELLECSNAQMLIHGEAHRPPLTRIRLRPDQPLRKEVIKYRDRSKYRDSSWPRQSKFTLKLSDVSQGPIWADTSLTLPTRPSCRLQGTRRRNGHDPPHILFLRCIQQRRYRRRVLAARRCNSWALVLNLQKHRSRTHIPKRFH